MKFAAGYFASRRALARQPQRDGLLDGAERRAAAGGGEEFVDGGGGEGALDRFDRFVEPLVHGAEIGPVRIDPEWATVDPSDRVDGVDDFQNGDLLGRPGECESAAETSPGEDDPCLSQGLEDLGEIAGWDFGGACEVGRDLGVSFCHGDGDDGSEGVFGGGRNHRRDPYWLIGP